MRLSLCVVHFKGQRSLSLALHFRVADFVLQGSSQFSLQDTHVDVEHQERLEAPAAMSDRGLRAGHRHTVHDRGHGQAGTQPSSLAQHDAKVAVCRRACACEGAQDSGPGSTAGVRSMFWMRCSLSFVMLVGRATAFVDTSLLSSQIKHGSVGICCQTLVEAEAMVYGAGITDVLVSNQVSEYWAQFRFIWTSFLAELHVSVGSK